MLPVGGKAQHALTFIFCFITFSFFALTACNKFVSAPSNFMNAYSCNSNRLELGVSSGGLAGGFIEFTDVESGNWLMNGNLRMKSHSVLWIISTKYVRPLDVKKVGVQSLRMVCVLGEGVGDCFN